MEVRGTIHSIRQWEKLFIQNIPYELTHDGHFELSGFDPSKSASKVLALSEVYTKKYKLFPHGRKELWEERARVTFWYDEKRGIAAMRMSDRAMYILGIEIKAQFAVVKIKQRESQLGNGLEVRSSKDL